MTTMDPMDIKRLVDLANAVTADGPVDQDQVQKLIDSHDVVWGVWQDAAEPYGVGLHLIKGERALLAENKAKPPSRTALPCSCAEEAVALQEELGEPGATNLAALLLECGDPFGSLRDD